jgi:hypothetical protein
MKISLAFVHKYLISYSASWTGFPGRLPRTMNQKKLEVSELIDNQQVWLEEERIQHKKTMTLMVLMTPSDDHVKEVAWQWRLDKGKEDPSRMRGLPHHQKQQNTPIKVNRHKPQSPNCPKKRKKVRSEEKESSEPPKKRTFQKAKKRRKKRDPFFLLAMPAHLPRVGR